MLRGSLSAANHFQAAGEPSDYYFTVQCFISPGRVADQAVEMIDCVNIHIYIFMFIFMRLSLSVHANSDCNSLL